MLSIQTEIIEREIQIGQLFNELGFAVAENNEAKNEFDIQVLTPFGYKQIEGLRCSEKLSTIKLKFDNNAELITAKNHNLYSLTEEKWVLADNLSLGDKISTLDRQGTRLLSKEYNDNIEILCDLQVADVHCFYTNNVLSHNSHFLTMLGANALQTKKNVLHYTFELSETATGIRYDSNLTDIASNEIIANKEKIIDFYKNSKDIGRLVIKEYPPNVATINTLRQHVEKLSLTKGFVPDLITIDYADIMRSSRQFDALRHELKLVYEELRGWAMEMKIPIWTASQTNREATDKESVGLESIGEAYGKAQTADVILSISRRQVEKATGAGRIFVAKNRAGKDGLLFPIKIDTARSKFQVLGEVAMPTQEEEVDEKATLRRALKDKWKELQNDQALAADAQ